MNFKSAHIIGIGGVSMSAIAEYLLSQGVLITGSDRNQSEITFKLETLGAEIFYSHDKENIKNQDVVIKTAAVKNDAPEVIFAREKNIPVYDRAEFLGKLQKSYKNVICVAGTHGKTSTTSMLAQITLEQKIDPTIMVGSNLNLINGTLKIGSNDYFLIESCEYCNSFLSFSPTVAVINNIEADHLDFFKNLDEVIKSFSNFANLVPDDGFVIYNNDDANSVKSVSNIIKNKLSFGLNDNSDIYTKNLINSYEYYCFDVYNNDQKLLHIELSVPGIHNVYNALASIAVSFVLNLDNNSTEVALKKYTGPSRRFEKIGEYNGAVVVDDYAHHPTEILTTLKTANNMGFDRVICVFQSHTYTRTISLFDEFIEALKLCDILISAEIYSAREVNTTGISAKDMTDKIENSIFIEDFNEIENHLRKIAQKGDLIITMGAGELNKIAYNLVNN